MQIILSPCVECILLMTVTGISLSLFKPLSTFSSYFLPCSFEKREGESGVEEFRCASVGDCHTSFYHYSFLAASIPFTLIIQVTYDTHLSFLFPASFPQLTTFRHSVSLGNAVYPVLWLIIEALEALSSEIIKLAI